MSIRISAIYIALFLFISPVFGMQVPSSGSGGASAPVESHAGGAGQLSTQETVLIAVGAVCATILLLALIH